MEIKYIAVAHDTVEPYCDEMRRGDIFMPFDKDFNKFTPIYMDQPLKRIMNEQILQYIKDRTIIEMKDIGIWSESINYIFLLPAKCYAVLFNRISVKTVDLENVEVAYIQGNPLWDNPITSVIEKHILDKKPIYEALYSISVRDKIHKEYIGNDINRSMAFAEISFMSNKQNSRRHLINEINQSWWECVDQTAIAESFANLKILPTFDHIKRRRQDFNSATVTNCINK